MKVSLYIPCFNAKETIRLCLEAVLKQTYPLEEVLVIDDGSADNTFEIVTYYPVRIIRHPENKGLAAARNTAIKSLNTEFIAALDSDCLPDPEWLARLMRHFSSNKVSGSGGKLLERNCSTTCDQWRSVHMKQHWGQKKREPSFLFGSNTVFRRQALFDAGFYNEGFKNNYEDVDLCRRIRKDNGSLVYDPEAVVSHLRRDNLDSLLNTYWLWHLGYYQQENFYLNEEKFALRVKDNIGLANRYLEEDIAAKRYNLIYLDFLLAFHHSLRDLGYFISQNNEKRINYSSLAGWLSLVDLSFFYHFDSGKKEISTLVTKENAILENFFALGLILEKYLQDKSISLGFKRAMYKHLLLSVYGINDEFLVDNLLTIGELHPDWRDLKEKKQPNFNVLFLNTFVLAFEEWLGQLFSNYKNILKLIEDSRQSAD